jgi:hypothetical protein
VRQHDRDLGVRPGLPLHQRDRIDVAIRREPAAVAVGVGDRRRQPDAAQPRRQPLEPGQAEREQVAALAGGKGVHLVDDDGAQGREKAVGLGVAEQQAERFGRGQQHLRRARALARLAVGGRVAGPGLDADVEAHLGDRIEQVALHVDRERLQGRDVESVEALRRVLDQLGERGQEPGQRLAGSGGGHEQRAAAATRRGEHLQLMAPRGPALGRKPVGEDGRERPLSATPVASNRAKASLAQRSTGV